MNSFKVVFSSFIFVSIVCFAIGIFASHDLHKKNTDIANLQNELKKMETLIVLTPGDTLTIRETAVLGANAAIQLSQQKQQITPDSVFEMWLRLYYSRIQNKQYQDFKNRVGFEAVPDSTKTDSTQ